jgi:nucleoside-triphosphatase
VGYRMMPVHILTGPVQTGKTTRLMQWIKKHRDCAGILSPIINNKRHIYSILSDKSRCLEIDNVHSREYLGNEDFKNIIIIGKYNFSTEVFGWAKEHLQEAAKARKKWLIIDEIGPLELNGQGLEPAIDEIIKNYEISENHRLLIVVRENLVSDVIRHYQIENISRIDRNLPETE